MNIEDIIVEKVDILKEMEVLNGRMREKAIENSTEERIKAYDCGVKNTMECLKSLITHETGEEKDRLIYQKYGKQSDVVRFVRLSDALKEMERK